jgi:hypothetical protein
MMWLRQMAQLSTTMSHAHRATAFHCVEETNRLARVTRTVLSTRTFFTSNRFFSPLLDPPAEASISIDAMTSADNTNARTPMTSSLVHDPFQYKLQF